MGDKVMVRRRIRRIGHAPGRALLAMLLASACCHAASEDLVRSVRQAIAQNDFARAERESQAYESKQGVTPDLAVAVSWMARGALAAGKPDRADAYASKARDLSLQLLKRRGLDDEPALPIALGASIEVHAQALSAQGETTEAVEFLKGQLDAYGLTSMRERIQKNINLLSLEGKPAPALERKQWSGPEPPSLASLRGRPVLLFFWAHWCPDCKGEAPILANIMKVYGPKGLALIGPTKLYGYTARGAEATPQAEAQYIDQVRGQYYQALSAMPAPIGGANFGAYGASTVPTLVLVDAAGVVRMYHPGALPERELASRIDAVLGGLGGKK